jgi:hypothetical protein
MATRNKEISNRQKIFHDNSDNRFDRRIAKQNWMSIRHVKQMRLFSERESVKHLGCYSYPMCGLAPNGCRVRMGEDVEPYGWRD